MKYMWRKVIILVFTLVCCLSQTVFAQQETKTVAVYVDGLPVSFDTQPQVRNGRTLVPLRAIAKALNIQVDWDGKKQIVTAKDADRTVVLQVGKKTAYVSGYGKSFNLDAPPVIVKGRILIPLRFISEAFDCKVGWDSKKYEVRIESLSKHMQIIAFYALGDSKTSSWEDLFGENYPKTGKGNTDLVGQLALGWYSLDQQGNLITKSRTGWQRPDGWEKVLEAAGEYNMQTEMVIHMTDKDNLIFNMITDQSAVEKAVEEIIREAESYDGVNLDFEGLGWKESPERLEEAKEGFNKFVQLLYERLRDSKRSLSLTLHPPNSAYQGYDYKTLGRYSDRIIIMAYDYGEKPEPVNCVTQAVEMAKEVVPAEKLILGISVPSETPKSIVTKVGIAKRYNLKGVAIWRLGLLSDEMWESLRSSIGKGK